jgi:hypothetical protein
MYEVNIDHPFHKMAKLYNNPNIESENWKVSTFTISYPLNWYVMYEQGIPSGTYVMLSCKNPYEFNMDQSCMMSDTPMEKFTNQRFLNDAKGDVLIAGLGIGLLPASLAEKDDVTSITIIELHQEVIDLVEPLIRKHIKNADKIKIIQGDAYKYPKDHPKEHYDYAYLDIWDSFPGSSDDLDMLNEIISLYDNIIPSGNTTTWGYEYALNEQDDNPVTVEAYGKYCGELYSWERKLKEFDKEAFDNMCKYTDEMLR